MPDTNKLPFSDGWLPEGFFRGMVRERDVCIKALDSSNEQYLVYPKDKPEFGVTTDYDSIKQANKWFRETILNITQRGYWS